MRVRHRTAFTLPEILVVFGIISLLMSLLFPTLSAARRRTAQVTCLANMQQLVSAFHVYLADNRGAFPRPAQNWVRLPEDWIYFQPGRRSDDGAVTRYLGKRLNEDALRCPSDDLTKHRTWKSGPIWNVHEQQFLYSYAVNEFICRTYPQRTLKMTDIRSPSEKILLVDEAGTTVDDGCWAFADQFGKGWNLLSIRHEMRRGELEKNFKAGNGNVAFADGHAGVIARIDSFNARYY
ncbi:MAG: type II secretion system protein, partial [Tepidisphaeraceae bacterium]